MLTYFELYHDRFGLNAKDKFTISETDFAMITTLLSENEDLVDVQECLEEDLRRKGKRLPMAFFNLLTNDYGLSSVKEHTLFLKKLIRSLDKKGFYAAMWEEGVYAISAEGFEKQAVAAIGEIEMQLDGGEWLTEDDC